MHVDDSSAILVPNAIFLPLFSIPESNRLGVPIPLITVQSASLHFFFLVLTVVLIKEYFGYLVVNFLIAEAVPKSLAYRPTSQEFRLDIFRAFVYLLHLLFSVSKLRISNILSLKLEH